MRLLTAIKSCSLSAGGVSRLWLTDWVPHLEINRSLTQDGLITGIATVLPWLEFSVEGSRVLINQEKVDSKHGLLLRDRLQTYYPKQEAAKWKGVMEQLTGRFMALYRDANGLYFLSGWQTGYTVDDFTGGTGVKAEANGYGLTYSSFSTLATLEVAPGYIAEVVEAPVVCPLVIDLNDQTPLQAVSTCVIYGVI